MQGTFPEHEMNEVDVLTRAFFFADKKDWISSVALMKTFLCTGKISIFLTGYKRQDFKIIIFLQ